MAIGAVKLIFDVDELTLEDIEDIAGYLGETLEELGERWKQRKLTPKDVTALAWIAGRAQNPGFTLEDAKKLKFTQIEF